MKVQSVVASFHQVATRRRGLAVRAPRACWGALSHYNICAIAMYAVPPKSHHIFQPPPAEGGALRSQSLLRAAGPAVLSGAILRVDPDSGAGLPDNPLAGSAEPNARRIIAHGLRNPFRITPRPDTDEIWVGDVDWNDWEEINRFSPSTSQILNFGWPCYEGSGAQPAYKRHQSGHLQPPLQHPRIRDLAPLRLQLRRPDRARGGNTAPRRV